ncbi:MAG: hypothetical protein CVU70_00810 [Deltaproteobacteria bacterium HGW-Deltaproteobacteria-5]|nr:MAG: hypothetical protein CVU70_00810 [Deltaproteobacteria bacterium HGW-Deltaproteobacteria-5]
MRPGTVWPTQRLDVFFEYLASNTRKLKNRALVRLHTGTAEIMTRIVLMDADELSPGENTFAQLILANEDVVVSGDHFVLRSYSPVTTIGGGIILDPLPGKHKRNQKKTLSDFRTLLEGSLPDKIMVLLERAGFAGIPIRSLSFRLGVHAKKIREALEKLLSSHQAILLSSDDTTVLSVHLYAQMEELILKSLADYHRKNPLKEGISKEELKAALASTVSAKLFNMVLVSLGKKENIVINKDNVRMATHQVLLAGEEDALHQSIASTYDKAGLTPPSLSDVIDSFKDRKVKAQNIIKLMLKDGELVKINEDLCFAKTVLEKLRLSWTVRRHRPHSRS